jgi:hypothetical protein
VIVINNCEVSIRKYYLPLVAEWTRFFPLKGISDKGPAPSLRRFSGLEGMLEGGRNTIISRRTALKM